MYSNILTNPHLEFAPVTEGAEVICRADEEIRNFPIAAGWCSQQCAPGAEVAVQRIEAPGPPGCFGGARFTVLRPATSVTGLDRLQMFQAVMWHELHATGLTRRGPTDPLFFHFDILANAEIEVSACINSGTATRNFTTNRSIPKDRWTSVDVTVPADGAGGWLPGAGEFGLYFQMGLSCGETRVAPKELDGMWNDGHWLMIESERNKSFLQTAGCTATIANLSLSLSPFERYREPSPVGLLRAAAVQEKSYPVGIRPGTPGAFPGSERFFALSGNGRCPVRFQVEKRVAPEVTLYSPGSGEAGMAHDVDRGTDIPITIESVDSRGFLASIPGAVQGSQYAFHWLAARF